VLRLSLAATVGITPSIATLSSLAAGLTISRRLDQQRKGKDMSVALQLVLGLENVECRRK